MSSDDYYATRMGRSLPEKDRMDHQCQLITAAVGWAIHPTIADSLPAAPAIADVATATAHWLRDLTAQYPEARLDGYDISAAFWPKDFPPQIKLTPHDAKLPFPAELHGVYDLVHVRYIVSGIAPTEWESTLQNLLTLVKPGGYIQWEEPDLTPEKQFRRSLPTSRTDTLEVTSLMFRKFLMERFEHGWNELPGLMNKAGLEVATGVTSTDRTIEGRREFTENGVILLLTSMRAQAEKGAPGAKSLAEVEEIGKKLADEIESGGYVRYDIYSAIGRKPA